MESNRIERMRRGREIPQVTLQRYNLLRSKHPGKFIFSFEGFDDVSFYDVMFRRTKSVSYVPFVCKGKDKVLDLRLLLSRNIAKDCDRVRYFIDKDFDGLKGHPPGLDVYCTPCYSFENLLVNKTVLQILLTGEYRCSDENADADIDIVTRVFDERLSEFIECMHEANLLIYHARKNGIKLSDIKEDLNKYLSVTAGLVKLVINKGDLHQLVGYCEEPKQAEILASKIDFDKLDPCLDWRGKFIFSFFRKFLLDIKEDRGSKAPQYFASRANMSFTPGGDIIRSLASIISIPACFATFVSASC